MHWEEFPEGKPRFLERYNATVPAARMAVEDEVRLLVAFLADPARSDYIAGQTIYLDGSRFGKDWSRHL